MDFTDLQLPDKSFKLVVWDPPHIIRRAGSPLSIIEKKYGVLLRDTWKEKLSKGFSECWRVLDDQGVLVFKWAEESASLQEVLSLFSEQPLFGQKSGSKTHWLCWMKTR